MTDASTLRLAFREFLGAERFRKFVKTGCNNRLLFWQEVEWSKFLETHPHFNRPLVELQAALRICEIHETELLPDTAEIFQGNVDLSPTYVRIRNELFPHAAQDPISTEGSPCTRSVATIWYCRDCRTARDQWLLQNA